MKFESRDDIEAPIAHVFQHMIDFAGFERQALRRGADVHRRDTLPRTGVGMVWDVTFLFRGKERQTVIEVISFDAPNSYSVRLTSSGIEAILKVDLVALSRARTRLTVTLELTPKTLAARLLVQSLKLAKGNLNKRFTDRVTDMALNIQHRYTRAT